MLPVMVFAQLDQQMAFNQLSVDDGLSQNSVVSISQDVEGYLWFATQDGLNKYDGNDFVYYPKFYEDVTREDYSRLGKIYASPSGRLYSISLQNGLECYSEELSDFVKSDFQKTPSVVLEDANENLWIGTYGSGLYVARTSQQDTIQVLTGVDALKDIYSLYENDTHIIAAAEKGLLFVDKNAFTYQNVFKGSTQNFSSIAKEANGAFWVGSFGDGLYRLSSDEKIEKFNGFTNGPRFPVSVNVQCVLIDKKDRLWVGTYGDGVYLVDFVNRKIDHLVTRNFDPQAIHYNDIISMHEDFTGIIWIGTDGGGISYYDENLSKFNSLLNSQIPEFANVDVARAITTDASNNLWIGTSGKGLTKINGGTREFTSYKVENEPPFKIASNRIMSLMHKGGAVWLGYQDEGMAIILEDGSIKRYETGSKPALVATTIWALFNDSKDRVWLGTQDEGLVQFDPKTGVKNQFKKDNSKILTNEIRVITEDDQGALWLANSSEGLMKFIPDTGHFISFKDSKTTQIKSLFYKEPFLWIGTNGNGLQVLNTKTEERFGYTTANGLPNNVIYGILPATDGSLWLSSNRGISKFMVPNRTKVPEITNYTNSDGLQAMEFNTGASYLSPDGTLYFGGINGINWFKPENLSANKIAPRTVLKNVSLFNEPFRFQNKNTFSYKENTLTFSFAALHFSQPEKNQYKYILDNYETSWSKPSTINEAHYPNLPSGDYMFKVLSSNYEGVWDATSADYPFTIHPPWYLTTVAKTCYLLLFGLLLFAIYSYLRWRWNMKMRLQWEHQETERLMKLDELKSKLYTNISHEFRTPLTLIASPVQQLINSTTIGENDRKTLQIIKGSSQRMLRLVNQLLDLSKLEKGAVELQVGRHQIAPKLQQLLEAFRLSANEKGIIITDVISEFNETWYDKDVFEKIVSNLLSNAVKYAPENSTIHFSARQKENDVLIHCSNENNSLSSHDIEKLFERFYQTQKNSEGVGVGLALIKELTQLANGTVYAEKESPHSITFTVRMPIAKMAYNENSMISEPKEHTFPLIETSSIFNDDEEESPHLLIVEDNLEISDYVYSLFADTCEITQARDGLEGIKTAIKEVPDIIISDIMMPKKDGIELCNTLKSDQRTSHIPIFLLTAKSGDEHELSGLINKADDYITKPFNSEILRQKVVNMIQARRALRKRYSQNVFLAPKEIAITSTDELFLQELQTILDASLNDSKFNAEGFAKAMTMSRMQLHRKLKALTGLSTSEFIRSQRLKSAVQLLRGSDLTINEVAYTVGFNTPSYFIRCFKETYGTTPKEYLKKE